MFSPWTLGLGCVSISFNESHHREILVELKARAVNDIDLARNYCLAPNTGNH